MKITKSLLLAVLIGVFAPLTVWAGTAQLTWVNPTTRTDGSALTNLAGILLEYGTCTSTNPAIFGTKQGEFFVAAPATSYTFQALPTATYCFRALARDSNNLQSAFTNAVFKNVVDAPPNPPTGLQVVAQTVFNIVKLENRFALLPVGTVPANTPCDSTQQVNGYYAVPRDQVTWFGNVRPQVVVAQCG
jgi:hypothetical protein